MDSAAYSKLSAVLVMLAVAACTPLPQRSYLPLEQRPSVNFDARRPNYVIMHYTSADAAERSLRTLTTPASSVSSHYLIGRDGKIYYLVDELARAWHAGVSYWGGNRDLNSASIGIELDNNGGEPYAEAQIESLLALLADLKSRYSIPAANFLGHSDVAPRRKADPGRYFPWQRLAVRGFGLWCDPPFAPPPPGTNDAVLLGALGYDVADMAAATGAFRLHFAPVGDPVRLTDEDRALAYCLLKQK